MLNTKIPKIILISIAIAAFIFLIISLFFRDIFFDIKENTLSAINMNSLNINQDDKSLEKKVLEVTDQVVILNDIPPGMGYKSDYKVNVKLKPLLEPNILNSKNNDYDISYQRKMVVSQGFKLVDEKTTKQIISENKSLEINYPNSVPPFEVKPNYIYELYFKEVSNSDKKHSNGIVYDMYIAFQLLPTPPDKLFLYEAFGFVNEMNCVSC